MSVTTQNIAEYVGVSRPVVSKVLFGGKSNVKVSEAMRQRVIAAAEELGYRTNTWARVARMEKTQTVGYVAFGWKPTVVSAGSIGVVGAMSRQLSLHEHRLVYSFVDAADFEAGQMPAVLAEAMVDAVVFDCSGMMPEQLVVEAEKAGVMHVAVNANRPVDAVYPDDEAVVRDAVLQLHAMGHRRFCFVETERLDAARAHYSVSVRRDSFLETMADMGLAARTVKLPACAESVEGAQQLQQLMANTVDPPTAYIGYALGQAAAVYMTALACGKSVPGDLSILAIHRGGVQPMVGNLPMSGMFVADHRLGEVAAELVLDKLNNNIEAAASRVLPYRFVEGLTIRALD